MYEQLSWKNSVKSINIFRTFISTTLAVEEFSLTWMDSLKFCANMKAACVYVMRTYVHITSKDTKTYSRLWNELFTCGMSRSFYILPISHIDTHSVFRLGSTNNWALVNDVTWRAKYVCTIIYPRHSYIQYTIINFMFLSSWTFNPESRHISHISYSSFSLFSVLCYVDVVKKPISLCHLLLCALAFFLLHVISTCMRTFNTHVSKGCMGSLLSDLFGSLRRNEYFASFFE